MSWFFGLALFVLAGAYSLCLFWSFVKPKHRWLWIVLTVVLLVVLGQVNRQYVEHTTPGDAFTSADRYDVSVSEDNGVFTLCIIMLTVMFGSAGYKNRKR